MLDFLFTNGIRETFHPNGQNSVEIRGMNSRNVELFKFTSVLPDPESQTRLTRIVDLVRRYGSALRPNAKRAGTFIQGATKVADVKVAIAAEDLGDHPVLQAELLNLDKSGRMAPVAIRGWLHALTVRRAAGQLDEAFQLGIAALERGHIPYIHLLLKDDTLLKRTAAVSTFEAGRKREAVDIIERLATDRLRRIEKDWKL